MNTKTLNMNNVVELENNAFRALSETMEVQYDQLSKRMGELETKGVMENKSMDVQTRLDSIEEAIRGMSVRSMTSGDEDNDAEEDENLKQYLRKGEVKGLAYDDAKGGALLSSYHYQKIIDSIPEQYPILSMFNRIDVRGREAILNVSNDFNTSRWFNPAQPNRDDSFKIDVDKRVVKLHTCVAVSDVNRDFLEDAGNNVSDILEDRISKDFSRSILKAALFGHEDYEPAGIIKNGNLDRQNAKVLRNDHILEDLMGLLGDLDQDYLENAAWFVAPSVFKKLIQNATQDNSRLKYVEDKNSSKGAHYILFGKPLFVVPQLDSDENAYDVNIAATAGANAQPAIQGKCKAVFADLSRGYYLLTNPDVRVKYHSEIADVDSVKYVYRMRVGGEVVDKKAFMFGVC